jgi:2-hydroxychromene-2-carboxylate isomerase
MSRRVTVHYGPTIAPGPLGWARLREIVARTGAAAHYRPVQSVPMSEASGTLPLAKRPKQRQAYRLMERRCWRDHLGIPLNLHPGTSRSTKRSRFGWRSRMAGAAATSRRSARR